MYKITIWCKYRVSDSFFEDVYEHLTFDQMMLIEDRFSGYMKSGECVALRIEIAKED